MAYSKLVSVITKLKKINNLIQFIIVAGRDEIMQKKLKKSKIGRDPLIKTFGFVDNLDEYMGASDLIFTKAGGLTVAECIAKGLPMVISDIIPGQEEDNVNFAITHNFGVRAGSAQKLAKVIAGLFSNKQRILEMKENCRKVAKPEAASEIADFIASKIS